MNSSRFRARIKEARWGYPFRLAWALINSNETRNSAYRSEREIVSARAELPSALDPLKTHITLLEQRTAALEAQLAVANEAIGLVGTDVPFSIQIPSGGILERATHQLQTSSDKDGLTLDTTDIPYLSLYSEQGGPEQRELVRQQFEAYLPLLKRDSTSEILDIGCGAGEFIAFLASQNMQVKGIDIDEFELKRAVSKGLDVEAADAFEFLAQPTSLSRFGAILLVEVIEHIDRNRWKELIHLCHDALEPGGLLLVETINPKHTFAFFGFYQDLTHLTPASEEFISFLYELEGFEHVNTIYSNPVIVDPLPRTDFKRMYFNFAVTGMRRTSSQLH